MFSKKLAQFRVGSFIFVAFLTALLVPSASSFAETYPSSNEVGQTNSSGGVNVAVPARAAATVQQITQFAGTDRYETSAKIAFAESTGAKSAVLVDGEGTAPDALSGGAYASTAGAALLLTQRDALPKVIEDRILELKIESVTLLGSEASISDAVVQRLRSIGITQIKRIAGVDRYDTSLLVSEQPVFATSQYAFVANGTNGVDAVSGDGVAGALGSPMVLVPSDGVSRLSADPRYTAIRAKSTVVVLGNQRAVDDDTYDAIGGDVRLGGSDRYITSIVIGEWSKQHGLPIAGITITTADDNVFVDALTAASVGTATLLTPSDHWTDEIYYFINDLKVQYIDLIGGQTPRQ